MNIPSSAFKRPAEAIRTFPFRCEVIAPPVAREEAVFRRKHPPDVFFAVELHAVSCQHVRRKKGEFLFHGIFGIVAAELIGRFDNLQHRVGEARIVNAVQNAPYNRRLLRRRRNDPRFAVDQLCKGFNLRRVRHIFRHRPARRKKNGGRLVYLFKRSGGRVLRLVRRTAPAPRHKRRKKGITQNPSLWNPLIYPENNKQRREIVLKEMYDQHYIKKDEYDQAMEESANMTFVGFQSTSEDDDDDGYVQNWYIDQLYYDLKSDLAQYYNISEDAASDKLYTEGLKIYCAMDEDMQNYIDAKMRITQNQTEEDCFIFWNDDPIVTKELAKYNLKSHLCPFSEFKEEGCVGYIEDGKYKLNFPSTFEMPQADMSLRGKHNIYNSLAAGLACNIVGIDHETLHKGLSDFPGVEHRLEKVGKFQGVYYVNDSKATNVDACWYALESMTTPTILIIGGKDKGNDYNQIKDLVKEKCTGIVYLGADNQKLHDNFDALGIPVRDTHSMKDCVAACQELAKPGDTVLLSPCCASFDLFKNMEDRGEQFKALARAIGE